MSSESGQPVTLLLNRLAAGDREAGDQIFPLIYNELRRLAAAYLRRERPEHTLQPTALVHEAYIRLVGSGQTEWKNRAHFFGVAAIVMRQILVDHARRRLAGKRGSGGKTLALDEALIVSDEKCDLIVNLDEALTRLAEQDPRQAKIVEMRYFAGLTEEEIGLILGISSRTVKRDWAVAKAWLAEAVAPGA